MRFVKPERARSGARGSGSDVRDRFAPRPTAGLVLTGRDDEVLADLLLLRVMSRSQIQARHFGSLQRCNARLRQLFDWGIVSRSFAPTAPFVSEGLYSVGPEAAGRIPAIAASLGLDLDAEDLRVQTRRPALSLVEHALLIGTIYAVVRQSVDDDQRTSLSLWLPERFVRREYEARRAGSEAGSRWRLEVFNPDAFFSISDEFGSRADLLLEADCGNTNAGQFTGKVRISARFLASDLAGGTIGTNAATTLVVTTAGERRIRNLSRIAEAEDASAWRFTTLAALESSGLFGRIWYAPGGDQPSDISDAFLADGGRSDR